MENKVIENLKQIADMEVRVHVIGNSPEAARLRVCVSLARKFLDALRRQGYMKPASWGIAKL